MFTSTRCVSNIFATTAGYQDLCVRHDYARNAGQECSIGQLVVRCSSLDCLRIRKYKTPETGYEPTRRYESKTYPHRQPERQMGFFLRTRVKLDENGNIVSANYAKIYEDFRFDARGLIRLWYYFNPTPNDRNLEFDTRKNLFPPGMENTRIINP